MPEKVGFMHGKETPPHSHQFTVSSRLRLGRGEAGL